MKTSGFLNHSSKFFFICACFTLFEYSRAVTLVYNLRVRRLFNIEPVLKQLKSRKVFSTVPLYFSRNSDITTILTNLKVCEKRRAGGTLLNLRYVHSKHWWMEATTGIETDHGTFTGGDPFKGSRSGVDDLVFASGYRHFVGDRVQIVGYGLVGFPTTRTVTLEDRYGPFVGTRFYNIGVGLEGSYSFVNSLRSSFSAVLQGRFIHGFNRSWVPILPADARIQPGNVSDMLFTLQYRIGRTVVETGYDLTVFSQQALILPVQTVKTDTFVRHGGYVTVSHVIPKGVLRRPIIFGTGGNLNHSKKFDTTSYTVWIFGSIVF